MNFLEKDLEDILFSTDSDLLYDRGLPIYDKRKRQLRVGNYGVLDMIAYEFEKNTHYGYTTLHIELIELKKENVNIDTLLQAINYAKGIERYLDKRKFVRIVFDIKIILIGKTVDKSSPFVYITDLINGSEGCNNIYTIDFYEYNYKIDGLHFKQIHGYSLINEGF